jgi:hypothetical protein
VSETVRKAITFYLLGQASPPESPRCTPC